MSRARTMGARLPTLYRQGETVEALLGVLGLQLEVLEEDQLEVKRAHWFDAALESGEVERLAALLGLEPEPWQDRRLFRRWVHALRNAMVQGGSLTPAALMELVTRGVREFQQVTGFHPVRQPLDWARAPDPRRAVFWENPTLRRTVQVVGDGGGVAPLQRFELEQRGLHAAQASFLLVGLPRGPEAAPCILNLTTGQALVYRGLVPPGRRLWIRGQGEAVTALLEDEDVSERLYTVSGVVPGEAWSAEAVETPPAAFHLPRGRNELWFLPLAHFDTPGLDRFLLALPDLELRQGRFDETRFGQAIFRLPAAARLHVGWLESQPAEFQVELPAGMHRHPPGRGAAALAARESLRAALARSVARLRAAGVRSQVRLRPLRETQWVRDRLLTVSHARLEAHGSPGVDARPRPGGALDVTDFDESVFE